MHVLCGPSGALLSKLLQDLLEPRSSFTCKTPSCTLLRLRLSQLDQGICLLRGVGRLWPRLQVISSSVFGSRRNQLQGLNEGHGEEVQSMSLTEQDA